MRNRAAFGQTSIGGGHFEGFRELVGSDFMEFNEVLGDKGSCHSRIDNSGSFDGFQTSFGNKSHRNM
jgi:hypothetical protein